MLTTKFALKKERIYVTDDLVCNGHWLLIKSYADYKTAPKSLREVLSLKNGQYSEGIKGNLDTISPMPNLKGIIPKRDGYLKLLAAPVGVSFANEYDIRAYKFKTALNEPQGTNEPQDITIGVDVDYVPLLKMGTCFAKDALSPILILAGDTLNDDLIGIVMPMRV